MCVCVLCVCCLSLAIFIFHISIKSNQSLVFLIRFFVYIHIFHFKMWRACVARILTFHECVYVSLCGRGTFTPALSTLFRWQLFYLWTEWKRCSLVSLIRSNASNGLTFISKSETSHLWEFFEFFQADKSRAFDSHNCHLVLFHKSRTRFRFLSWFLVHQAEQSLWKSK